MVHVNSMVQVNCMVQVDCLRLIPTKYYKDLRTLTFPDPTVPPPLAAYSNTCCMFYGELAPVLVLFLPFWATFFYKAETHFLQKGLFPPPSHNLATVGTDAGHSSF